MMARARRRVSCSRGQSLVEFAMVLPLLLVLVLGIVEGGYALLHQHIASKLSREGSNLISRDATLMDAATALKSMSSAAIDFDNGSKVIFSVIKDVATIGASNYDKPVLYQRYEYGTLAAQSTIATAGSGSFGGAPDFVAANSDNDTSLQITNLPPNLITRGGLLYVAEIFTTHPLITPLSGFGITMPSTLFSIAYF
jgi:Flp pilus assembly protein TadG